MPVTTKDDSFEHGIGLANVRNTVEKYHGELIIKTENKKVYCRYYFVYIKQYMINQRDILHANFDH